MLLSLLLLVPPGLLHGESPDWVGSFVAAAGQRFEAELAAGQVDGPRLLLRLFACLSRACVLHHADVVGLMQRLVEVAHSLAASGAVLVMWTHAAGMLRWMRVLCMPANQRDCLQELHLVAYRECLQERVMLLMRSACRKCVMLLIGSACRNCVMLRIGSACRNCVMLRIGSQLWSSYRSCPCACSMFDAKHQHAKRVPGLLFAPTS
jgi:hypothetical protein